MKNVRTLIADIETYLLDYSAFPVEGWSFVLALWALGTWCYQSFDAFPYLVITSATKRSGKTRLGVDLLSPVACKAFNFAAMTPAVLFHTLKQADRDGATIVVDEAEVLSGESASDMRSVLNAGYRRGQSIPRMVQGEVELFPCYGPKMFILIGDVFDTLRDRSIVIDMVRSTPRKIFRFSEAKAVAALLAERVKHAIPEQSEFAADEPFDCYSILEGREAEIWTPLFTVCKRFCPERLEELTMLATDLAANKTADKTRYTELAQAEEKAQEDSYTERALRDLANVCGPDRAVFTSDAIDRMKAIPAGPWRMYRGSGLTPMMLSDMLSRFKVAPKLVKISGKTQRGYQVKDIAAAIAKLGPAKVTR